MDAFAQFKQTFFDECAELLAASEGHLADLEAGRADAETLHAIFRAIHSIKGGAGAFGFARLVSFAHVFETLLDGVREGRVPVAGDSVRLLIRANDAIGDLVRAAQNEEPVPEEFGAEIAGALQAMMGGTAPSAASSAASSTPASAAAAAAPAGRRFRIRFAPRPDMLRKANEPLLLFRELRRLGTLAVAADSSRVPGLGELKADEPYLAWTLELETSAAPEAVREVFEFVEDDCELDIAAVAAPTPARAEDAVGDPAPGGNAARAASAAATSIRVGTDKVDRLVDLVGELVTSQAMLAQQASELPPERYPAFLHSLHAMSQHTRELQESVMAIRAQPVKSVFARMPKLVRELAAGLGKDVRLVATGENTEIDKTVVEQLGDPLTHMIRNAVDHGMETPEERVALGKPPQGTIHLSAEHRGGRIVIEISDDGRGINRPRVLEKAKEKGLVPVGATPSDEEIDNLIFLPGFSTAEKVSNVSGRGVGMDVVKRNIQSLGGRIAIASTPGAGSRFTLSLPLTLAVLDGMIVGVGGEAYIVPITAIIESLRPLPSDVRAIPHVGDVVAVRGEQVRLAYLHRQFGVPGAVTDPAKGIVVLVETDGGGKLGLVADELLGQQQVVIKSLETNYGPIEGVAAATILGSGKVALILDVAAVNDRGRRAADRDARWLPDTTAQVH